MLKLFRVNPLKSACNYLIAPSNTCIVKCHTIGSPNAVRSIHTVECLS